MLKIEMLTFQLNANVEVKILFGKIIHRVDPKVRKILVGACMGTRIPHSMVFHDLVATEI